MKHLPYLRQRILHGWSMRNHTPEDREQILKNLESGQSKDLEGTIYYNLALKCDNNPTYLGKAPRYGVKK